MKKFWGFATLIGTILFSQLVYSNFSSKPNVLVYTTIRPSFWEIYLNKNGETKQLTKGAGLNYNPTFSPDRNWLIFSSEKTGNLMVQTLEG